MSDKQLYYLLFKCSNQHPKHVVYEFDFHVTVHIDKFL